MAALKVDTIVVGAGPAGCVVARRLLDAGHRVVLIEAGPGAPSPAIESADAIAALGEDRWLWPGVEAHRRGRPSVRYRRGRGLGGGSAINTLVATVGDRRDYDRWVTDQGCSGWDGAAVTPWLGSVVEAMGPQPATFGPLATLLTATVEAAGHRVGGASVDLDGTGYRTASLLVAGGRRRSAAGAYLGGVGSAGRSAGSAPGAGRSPGSSGQRWNGRLSVMTSTVVRRVLVDRERVTGVELVDGGVVAGPRVVIAAGALQTPVLLARSGIDHPALGATAEDHPSFVFTVDLPPERRHRPGQVIPPISAVLRWSSSGDLSAPGADGADLMALVMDHVGVGAAGRRFGAVIVTLTDVRSRGRVELDGRDPDVGPRFWPGWLDDRSDRRRLRLGVRHVAQLLTGDDGSRVGAVGEGDDGPVSVDDRGTPLRHLSELDDDELDRWLLDHPGPVSHVASTCPMGPGPDAVVDLDGRVRGVEGLTVVDASVLPHLPNANPQIPVMAVADRIGAALVGR